MKRSLLAVAACGLIASAPARADIATLSATFDGFLQNTVFTVTNTSTVSESVELLTNLGANPAVTLPTLAAGLHETYSFNRISGGFENDPASAGIPDTTTYTLLVGLANAPPSLASNVFSPVSNLTGGVVDFLGNNCNGFSGGAGNNGGTCGGTIALSGVVASVPTPAVPEPGTLALLASGAALLFGARRRAA